MLETVSAEPLPGSSSLVQGQEEAKPAKAAAPKAKAKAKAGGLRHRSEFRPMRRISRAPRGWGIKLLIRVWLTT